MKTIALIGLIIVATDFRVLLGQFVKSIKRTGFFAIFVAVASK